MAEMYDDGYETEATHVSVIAINPDGKIPMALQLRNDAWSLPKGGREEDETATEAAYREFTEETGIAPSRLERLELLDTALRYSIGRAVTHHMAYFTGTTFARRDLTPRGRDIVAGRWFTPEEALDNLGNPVDRSILQGAIPHLKEMAAFLRGER
jgi:8-oxo-dGTP pyrophosphatase MutT (NUDIX family)